MVNFIKTSAVKHAATITLALLLATLPACDLRPLTAGFDAGARSDGPRVDGPAADLPDFGAWPDASAGVCPGPPSSRSPDPTPGGRGTSIAVDPKTGAIHVGQHAGEPAYDARYSLGDKGGAWASETIHSAGRVGEEISLVLTPDGTAHAVFNDLDNTTLLHGVRGAGSWTVKPISGTRHGANDLAVDASGQLHLVATGTKSYTLIYRRYSGGAWQPEVLLSTKMLSAIRKPAVAVDSAGTIHVAHGTSDDALNYLSGSTSGSFGTPVVLATGVEDVGAAMALDAKGRAHVIYNDELNKLLMYTAQQSAGGLFSTPVTLGKLANMALTYFGNYADLVHHAGTLWAVYAGEKNVLSLRRTTATGSWQPAQTLTFCCSSMISAAAAPDGALQIAHWDVAANRLRVTKVCPD